MKSCGLIISVLVAFGLAAPALGAPLDAPTVSSVAADRTSITIQVQAGSGGAPAGFIVEWVPADRYNMLGGWPVSSSLVSRASFTGTPSLYLTPGVTTFHLDVGQVVEVVLGKSFDETGLEGSDHAELAEGTEYAVRARAAAMGPGFPEGVNSNTIICSTLPRIATDCTVTQGYWKNHPESWSRVPALTLGSVTYAQAQILAILRQPARGNGLISLAHQVIAARLNLLLGVVPPASVNNALYLADTTIGTLVVPPVGGGRLLPCSTSALTETLDQFNSGSLGPGHCPDDLRVVRVVGATWGTLKSIYR